MRFLCSRVGYIGTNKHRVIRINLNLPEALASEMSPPQWGHTAKLLKVSFIVRELDK